MEISALDLYYFVKELKELEGAIVSQIYQPNEFIIALHKKGKKYLNIFDNYVFLKDGKSKQKSPNPFVMFFRKNLVRSKLEKAKQIDFERILELKLNKFGEIYYLYIELFSRGNLVLTDEKKKIIIVKRSEEFKARVLKKGEKYVLPPSRENVRKMKLNEFEKVLKSGKRSTILKTLAVEFGFGGKYATEICELSGISKKETEVRDSKTLFENVCLLFDKEMNPNVGQYANPFLLISDAPEKSFETFSEAIDYKQKQETKEIKKDSKKAKMLEKQKEVLENGLKRIEELEQKANLIYSNMNEIQSLIDEVNSNGWGINHKMIKQKKPAEKELIIEVKE